MTRPLDEFGRTVSVGGRPINNLRFADDINLSAGSMKEQDKFTKRLNETASAFKIEINSEKSNILTTSGTFTDTDPPITVSGKQLKRVNEFKYLGFYITVNAASVREIRNRFAIHAKAIKTKKDLEEPCHGYESESQSS